MPVPINNDQWTGDQLTAFWKSANSKLIRYGGSWSNVIITKAKGTVMWVSQSVM
jgi:hypothetical protein